MLFRCRAGRRISAGAQSVRALRRKIRQLDIRLIRLRAVDFDVFDRILELRLRYLQTAKDSGFAKPFERVVHDILVAERQRPAGGQLRHRSVRLGGIFLPKRKSVIENQAARRMYEAASSWAKKKRHTVFLVEARSIFKDFDFPCPKGLCDVDAVSFDRNHFRIGKYPQPHRKREGIAGVFPAPRHAETADSPESKSRAEELDEARSCQKVANIQLGPLDRLVAAPEIFVERSGIVPAPSALAQQPLVQILKKQCLVVFILERAKKHPKFFQQAAKHAGSGTMHSNKNDGVAHG